MPRKQSPESPYYDESAVDALQTEDCDEDHFRFDGRPRVDKLAGSDLLLQRLFAQHVAPRFDIAPELAFEEV